MEDPSEMSDQCLERLLRMIHKKTGVTIDKSRKSMLSSRLRKRLREHGMDSFDEYLKLVDRDQNEEIIFVNSVTTHETYLYRTPLVWDYFREFIGQHQGKPTLKIWSAACSTGEEPYTMAVFCEQLRLQRPDFSYSILATDISRGVVETAEEGAYSGRAIQKFNDGFPDLFKKYFEATGGGSFRASDQLRKNIQFKTHNLFDALKASENTFDLVFLRNVLIYFTSKDQEKVLANVFKVSKPEAGLVLGESESINRLDTDFDLVSPLIYRAKNKKGAFAA